MAGDDYQHGSMEIEEHKETWAHFMHWFTWGGLITLLAVGYATFTLGAGMAWIPALILCAIAGLGIGFVMGMGTAWVATVIGLCVFAAVLRGIIALAQLALG